MYVSPEGEILKYTSPSDDEYPTFPLNQKVKKRFQGLELYLKHPFKVLNIKLETDKSEI